MIYLPLIKDPNFSFIIDLDDIEVEFRFKHHVTTVAWIVDIDIVELGRGLHGQKVATDQDLLGGHAIIELGALYARDTVGNLDFDYDNFGDRYKIVYVTKAEMAEINAG